MASEVKKGPKGPRLTSLSEKARTLPTTPGCYLMKNLRDEIIYVGKAKNLKNRVMSYFNLGAKSAKTEILVGHIRDFEFILTDSETEAFILENNLIKKHSPKYNIRMRDDKSYPYLVADFSEPFPRILYARNIKDRNKKEVFGPFPDGSGISEVLRVVTKFFGLRDCTLREFNSRKDPCLLYQLNQCSAPCVELIDESSYEQKLENALNIFRGKPESSLEIINDEMKELAKKEEFEKAAIVRDSLFVLEKFLNFTSENNVEIVGGERNIDVVAFHSGDIETDVAIYLVRNGLLLGHKNFHFSNFDLDSDGKEEVYSFLLQYYTQTSDTLPEVIVLPFSKEQNELFYQAIQKIFEGEIKVLGPEENYSKLLSLTKQQATEHQRVRLSNQESKYVGLHKLKELLDLKERPTKLECYDVAIWQGEAPTAAQIVFVDGNPVKAEYRNYHLKTLPEGNNDFAMMKEVLGRRIKKGHLPDVFVVDGGKGQVSSFAAVLKDFDLSIPVVGIAKSKAKSSVRSQKIEKSEERLIIPGRANPYILKKNPSLFRIIVSMRDEAHRFSRRLHHRSMSKSRFESGFFDKIPGIGPKTKQKILSRLDSDLTQLRKLNVKEISALLDVSSRVAQNILDELNLESVVEEGGDNN